MNKSNKILAVIPAGMCLPLLFNFIWNMVVYNGSRLVTGGLVHYNLEIGIDRWIPFLPWTVSIYFGCFLFWGINFILACRQERTEVCRFLSAELLAKTLCLFCFFVLPTTNTRPAVGDATIWDYCMKWLYRTDAADNLFPSIHCLVSWFCYIGVRKSPEVPKWYKSFSMVFALLVCASTLTTKQHVIVDAFAGVLLAELCYLITERIGLSKQYGRLISKLPGGGRTQR